MSDWQPVALFIPAAHLDASNRLAAIIDPDVGGGKTWGEVLYQDSEGNQYFASQNWLAPEYLEILQSGNAELIMGALTLLAEERGRDLPTAEDCAAFAANIIAVTDRDVSGYASERGWEKVDAVQIPAE